MDPVPVVPDTVAELILQSEEEAAEPLFLLQDMDPLRRNVNARL